MITFYIWRLKQLKIAAATADNDLTAEAVRQLSVHNSPLKTKATTLAWHEAQLGAARKTNDEQAAQIQFGNGLSAAMTTGHKTEAILSRTSWAEWAEQAEALGID